jgi:hypothetical protein
MSVDEQDAGIRRLFPEFRQTCSLDFVGVWRGRLRPIATSYEVSIVYFPKLWLGGAFVRNSWVTVQVLDPEIGLDPRGTGEKLPHIYPCPNTRIGWSLCLYDPRTKDWKPSRSIAETIIPWTAEWLFFYEGWLIDGHWAGGGDHPSARSLRCPTSNQSYQDPPGRYRAAEFYRVGR